MFERAVCTIITKSYLAHARVLAKSIAKHNPYTPLYVLLADRIDGYFDPALEPFKIIYLEDLSDKQAIEKMCFYYTPFELCCALRGLLHEYMFDQEIAQAWLFLDSDIMVFSSLEPIFHQLKKASILLTPHSSDPVEEKYIDPHEKNFISSGLYNAGFLGLNRTKEARDFIHWFKLRLKYFCLSDPKSGLFVDQKWLNLVPLYFQNSNLYRHPGANLGHWNLFERTLDRNDVGYVMANGKPVLFVHFSGWDINNPSIVSKYSPMYLEKVSKLWVEIADEYRNLLLINEYFELKDYPYAFSCFSNGKLITDEVRRNYRASVLGGNELELSPFLSQDFFEIFDEKRIRNPFKALSQLFGSVVQNLFSRP